MAKWQLLRVPADKRLLTIFLNRADNRIEMLRRSLPAVSVTAVYSEPVRYL